MDKRRLLGISGIFGVMLTLLVVLSSQIVNAAPPVVSGCSIFPADNPWNQDVSSLPVMANSPNYIASINSTKQFLHPDFGSNLTYGIPYIVVDGSVSTPINFVDYGDESDPGPYPIPLNAPIEGGGTGGDQHVLAVNSTNCKLYELYNASVNNSHTGWNASSGAIFDLSSNLLRPLGWTSADAAGLPIFPGLARYDEVQSGVITHALRFTVQASQKAYILPATHFASSSTNPSLPPMGLRLRLKASFDISGYTGASKVILQALKTYGMIVADNGSSWYISGATDGRWNDNDLNQLKGVPGSEFEAVYTGPLVTHLSDPPATPQASASPSRNYFTIAKPTLTWNRVNSALRYDIEVANNSSFSGAIAYDAGNNLSFTWPLPWANGLYFWHTRACTGAASTTCGTWSAYDTFVVAVP